MQGKGERCGKDGVGIEEQSAVGSAEKGTWGARSALGGEGGKSGMQWRVRKEGVKRHEGSRESGKEARRVKEDVYRMTSVLGSVRSAVGVEGVKDRV